jgi:molybdopterin converting factor small subunit
VSVHPRERIGIGLMEVTVILKYSHYRKYLNDQNHGCVTVKEGATVKDLVEQLGVPQYYLHHVTINDQIKDLSAPLSDGVRVIIWPPMIGGG